MSPALSYHLNFHVRSAPVAATRRLPQSSELDRRRWRTLRTALKSLVHCSQAPGMTDAALQNDTTQSVTDALSSKRLMSSVH
jgi:hypothetical protein